MTWVAWRQHRGPALAVAALLTVVAGYGVTLGLLIRDHIDGGGLAACLAVGGDCGRLAAALVERFDPYVRFSIFLIYVPLLLGVFAGAPLVAREVERGTHRLAWTQGVSRVRWLATRLGVAAAVLAAGMAVLALVLGWLHRTYYGALGRDAPDGSLFILHDLIPAAVALCALAIGLATGAVLRRTLPAMAVTLVLGFAAGQASAWLRGVILPPARLFGTYGEPDRVPGGAMVVGSGFADGAGRALGQDAVNRLCPDSDRFAACAHDAGIQTVTHYYPAGGYWLLQSVEAGVLLGVAAVMVALAFWTVTRRAG